MAAGIDPNEKVENARQAAAERAGMTFEAVAEDFIKRHVRPSLKCAAATESRRSGERSFRSGAIGPLRRSRAATW